MARQTNFKDYDPSRDYDQERKMGRDRSKNVYGQGGDIDPGFGEGRDYHGNQYAGSDFYSGDRELPDYAGTPREHDIQAPYGEPLRRTERGRRVGARNPRYGDVFGTQRDRNYGGRDPYYRDYGDDWMDAMDRESARDPLRGAYAGSIDHDERYGHAYGGSGQGTRLGWGYEGARRERGEPWRREGPHTGRGPEGYRRAKERILEDAHARLTRHGGLDARKIQVKVDGDEITLEGRVDSRRAKRMAEDALETIPGVRDIHNRLRVEG